MCGMESAPTPIAVADIKSGDRYLNGLSGWRALEDATLTTGGVSVRVEYIPDGGHSTRVWPDPTHVLEVLR
jgi:hypothetical protein